MAITSAGSTGWFLSGCCTCSRSSGVAPSPIVGRWAGGPVDLRGVGNDLTNYSLAWRTVPEPTGFTLLAIVGR